MSHSEVADKPQQMDIFLASDTPSRMKRKMYGFKKKTFEKRQNKKTGC